MRSVCGSGGASRTVITNLNHRNIKVIADETSHRGCKICEDRGEIRLDKDSEMPQSRYAKAKQSSLHKYGDGPFCRFGVAKGCRKEGVYILSGGGNELYIGQCQNLEDRWGPRGYGTISPRNCFKGGQETNCRINNLILLTSKSGIELALWFL